MPKLITLLCTSAHDGAIWMQDNPSLVEGKRVLRIFAGEHLQRLVGVDKENIMPFQTEAFMINPNESLMNGLTASLPDPVLPPIQTIFVGDQPRDVWCLDLHFMSDTSGIPPAMQVDNQYRVFGSFIDEQRNQVHFIARGVAISWGVEPHICFTSEFMEIKVNENSNRTSTQA